MKQTITNFGHIINHHSDINIEDVNSLSLKAFHYNINVTPNIQYNALEKLVKDADYNEQLSDGLDFSQKRNHNSAIEKLIRRYK